MDTALVKRIFIFFLFVFCCLPVFADCGGHSCSQRLVVHANGDVQVNTAGDETLLDCDAGHYGYLRLNRSAANFAATYSLTLAAKMADIQLERIRATSTGQCEIAYVVHR
jgi:hypothetical protein